MTWLLHSHLYKHMQNSGHLRKIWNKHPSFFHFFVRFQHHQKVPQGADARTDEVTACWTCLKNSPWKSKTIKVKWFCWNCWWTKPLLKPSKTLYGCLFDSEIGIGGFAHVWCTMTDDIQTKLCTVSVGAKAKQDRVSEKKVTHNKVLGDGANWNCALLETIMDDLYAGKALKRRLTDTFFSQVSWAQLMLLAHCSTANSFSLNWMAAGAIKACKPRVWLLCSSKDGRIPCMI